ncbi:HAD-IC family P-type ATPase [Nitriliruptoraceae bacterium ZYF776]|nr:HAD-IC family P-type ATPase [Profundirhabdus halotolerans]
MTRTEPPPPPPPPGRPTRPAADPTRRARTGLGHDEVAARIEAGAVNDAGAPPSRSVGEIVRANVLTRFNFLIGGLLVVIILVAPIQDALFGLVAFTNTVIGTAQELRAKRTLDRLSVVSAPRARVVRDREVVEVDVGEVVLDEVLVIGAGDQLPVDARVLEASGLEANESLVTGEADAIAKRPGDQVLSGSFVVAGSARVQATAVGADSFAGRLTEEARSFELVRSDLRAGIDRILRVVTWVLVPTALLLLASQLLQDQGVRSALAGSVAGTVAIIPEGLVLLTSVAFAVAVVRLSRRQVLVQELPAVETLARVDVVCFDKTGTLTTGEIRFHGLETLPGASDVEVALGALAASEPDPNATLAAIADAHPDRSRWIASEVVPFSSARKWSAASFGRHGTWVLGAPDVLLAGIPRDPQLDRLLRRAIGTGYRIVLLARSDAPLTGDQLPGDLRPQALVALAETLREDAADTIGFFEQQGVRTLLISGDHPRTVAAIARQVGIEDVGRPVTGADLPDDPEALDRLLAEHRVFGRVTPDHKRALVQRLQANGHVVAMTGDGVNDVLALKDADIGIAMGNGAAATRNVAQLVLLDSDFAALPHVVAEGRRVIGNIEKVANLFVTKAVYATLLAIAIGVAQLPFPFLPRHLSLVGGLTIGIPAFFLALEPNDRRARPGFVKRAVAFALPAGAAAAAATFAAYWLAQTVERVGLPQARTTATITLFGAGVLVLRLVSRPLNRLRRTLLQAMVASFVLAFVIPFPATFFALEVPPPVVLLASVGVVALAALVMEAAAELFEVTYGWYRRRHAPTAPRTPRQTT